MSFWMARLKSSFVGFGGEVTIKAHSPAPPVSLSLYAFGKRETLHFVSSAESLDKLASIICATNTAPSRSATQFAGIGWCSVYTRSSSGPAQCVHCPCYIDGDMDRFNISHAGSIWLSGPSSISSNF
jgi:hypothetical protein